MGQRRVCRGGDLSLLSPIYGSDGWCERVGTSRFDLDEGNGRILFDDEVDLTTNRSPAACQDRVAVRFQVLGRKLFASPAERLTGVGQRSISMPSAPSSIGPAWYASRMRRSISSQPSARTDG
jgi:hypothetical protein